MAAAVRVDVRSEVVDGFKNHRHYGGVQRHPVPRPPHGVTVVCRRTGSGKGLTHRIFRLPVGTVVAREGNGPVRDAMFLVRRSGGLEVYVRAPDLARETLVRIRRAVRHARTGQSETPVMVVPKVRKPAAYPLTETPVPEVDFLGCRLRRDRERVVVEIRAKLLLLEVIEPLVARGREAGNEIGVRVVIKVISASAVIVQLRPAVLYGFR